MAEDTGSKEGHGRWSFVLGYGPTGTFGHVHLILTQATLPADISVAWNVDTPVPSDAKVQVEQAATSYLRAYLTIHSTLLHVTITEVRSDSVRRNDYERAVRNAMHEALLEMSLPLPQIFAAPDEDSTWNP